MCIGLALVNCRHEFVFKLMNLLTGESLLYYEIFLKELQKNFNKKDRAHMELFVLDVGCQLEAWWRK